MYAYRTLITHARYGCLVGCCLAGIAASPVLAAVNSNGFEVLSSKSTGVKSGQYIEAAVSAVYRHGGTAGNQGVYTKQLVPVATSTLRKGALSALGAGVMHPGFLLAITAAGLIYDELSGEIMAPDGEFDSLQQAMLAEHEKVPEPYKSGGPYVFSGGLSACNGNNVVFANHASHVACLRTKGTQSWVDREIVTVEATRYLVYSPSYGYNTWITYGPSPGSVTEPDYVNDSGSLAPATPEQLEGLDSHMPPQVYDELWNDGPIPEWQDEITVLGAPATYVQPTGDQAVAPEVASQIGKWGENVGAQLDGEPLPNPETDADGKTSTDSLYEELGLDDPVPDYPEPDVDWQTETLDLPSYSSGVGSGACPAPVSIPFPLGGGTFGWSYEPVCETAEMIRPAFLGVCGFVSLLIVLRARGGNG